MKWWSGVWSSGGLEPPTLDLQWVFNQAYDRGLYRRGAVDYTQSPERPLGEADLAWVSQMLAEQRAKQT